MSLYRAAVTVAAAIVVLVAGVERPSARQEPFRSAVDAVVINAVVTSGSKRVGGLTAADFVVTDNGVPQKILSVTLEQEPIDVTLVIDTSESVTGAMLSALSKAVEAVRQKLRRDDRVSVLTFSQVIRERLALGEPARARNLSIGPAFGMTSLYDATIIALSTPPVVDRRQMVVVFTDGVDTLSFVEADRALTAAGHAPAAIFGVAVFGAGAVPDEFFGKVTDMTGGMMQLVPSFSMSTSGTGSVTQTVVSGNGQRMTTTAQLGGATLDASFLRAFEEFRTSYVLRYTLANVPRAGWHDVAVSVTRAGKYSVRARKRYYG